MAAEAELGKFLEMERFSRNHFFNDRTEAQALLMMYSCIEVALKRAAVWVIVDSVEVVTAVQQLVVDHLITGIEQDPKGHNSRLAKIIKKTVVKTTKGKFDAKVLDEMKSLRDKIAHAACKYIDSTLEAIAQEKTISLENAWDVTLAIVEASKAFSDLHDKQKQGHFDALEAEAAGEDSLTDSPYDD